MENNMKCVRWFLIFCFFFAAPFAQAGEIERIQAKGELVVSLNKGYPPFSMVLDNQLRGLDVDLAALLADYLGVTIRFIQPETYDQQIPTLLAGKADIIIAAMTRTVDRGLKVSFTTPYFEVSQAALVTRELAKPGAGSYFDLVDIKGITLGVKANTTHERFARELFSDSAITVYPTAEEAAKGLVKGQVKAMVADSPFIRVWAKTHPEHYLKIKPLLIPVTREYYAFAIRHGDPVFLNWLNLFIDQIKTDGTLDLLTHEYFEQMPWLEKDKGLEKTSRALFLKNKFIARQRDMIEKRREKAKESKIIYD
jgi:polar amino acid transport system substrate-binding protein